MINIISWKCWGAGARYFPHLVQDLKLNYNVHILTIVETRVSGKRAEKIISKPGLSNNYRVEATGFSGRIWLLWEGECVSVNIISYSSQYIHTNISYNASEERFLLTCVYGSPTPSIRQGLWTQLETISYSVGASKWLCVEDFNAYKKVDDKQGGAKPNVKAMSDFASCCSVCNLMDLKFYGPKFT